VLGFFGFFVAFMLNLPEYYCSRDEIAVLLDPEYKGVYLNRRCRRINTRDIADKKCCQIKQGGEDVVIWIVV
jgi:hypothetical protein